MTRHLPGATTIKLLRGPTHLYDWRAGWILGRRFLRLTHIGRRSGRRYQTMLEVIGENHATGEVIVIAGLGRSANWYRNLQTHEAIEVAIGSERFTPRHRQLNKSEAATAGNKHSRPSQSSPLNDTASSDEVDSPPIHRTATRCWAVWG